MTDATTVTSAPLDAFEQLQHRLGRGASLEDLVIQGLSPLVRDAQTYCAVPRGFDREFFDHAVRPRLREDVAFDSVLGPFSEGGASGRVRYQPRYRKALLSTAKVELQGLLHASAEYFGARAKGGIDDVCARLLFVPENGFRGMPAYGPEALRESFYGAESRGDVGFCEAVLEAANNQWAAAQDWSRFCRDNDHRFKETLRELRSQLACRKRWHDQTSRVGQTYIPEHLERATREMLDPARSEWLHELAARGGSGKTTYLRWLIAQCVDREWAIPCSLIDFDFVRPSERELWMLLLRIIQDLDIRAGVFGELLRDKHGLVEALAKNPGAVDARAEGADVSRRFVETVAHLGTTRPDRISGLIVLDTLEEVIRETPRPALDLLNVLTQAHQQAPTLRVVLAGRYGLLERATLSVPISTVGIVPFTPEETANYLRNRRAMTRDSLISAIVDKSQGLPMKAALLADLCETTPSLSEEDLRASDDVDITYLILRVIDRIPDKALRWVVRYACLAERLTRAFVEEVMEPFLADLFSGRLPTDNPDHRLSDELQKKRPFPMEPEELLKPGEVPPSMTQLWARLSSYVGEVSWITREMGSEALVVHSEVRDPMRKLLSGQLVTTQLHERAHWVYTERARRNPAAWCDEIMTALAHAEALGARAIDEWRAALSDARSHAPADHVRLAQRWSGLSQRVPALGLGGEFADEARAELLKAHLGRALAQDETSDARDTWQELQIAYDAWARGGVPRRTEDAETRVAGAVLALRRGSYEEAERFLASPDAPAGLRAEVGLHFARACERSDPARSLQFLATAAEEARRVPLPRRLAAEVGPLPRVLAALGWAQIRCGRRLDAADTVRELQRLRPGDGRFEDLVGEALGSGALAPGSPVRLLAEAREAIVEGDAQRALDTLTDFRAERLVARAEELRGLAESRLCNPEEASECFYKEKASTGDYAAVLRSLVGQARVSLYVEGNVKAARSTLETAENLRTGQSDLDLDVGLLKVDVLERALERDAARALVERLCGIVAHGSPHDRVRVALVAARHDVRDVPDIQLESVGRLLEEIQTVDARLAAIADVEFDRNVLDRRGPLAWIDRALPLGPTSPWRHWLLRAHLARYAGDPDESRRCLEQIDVRPLLDQADAVMDLLRAGNAMQMFAWRKEIANARPEFWGQVPHLDRRLEREGVSLIEGFANKFIQCEADLYLEHEDEILVLDNSSGMARRLERLASRASSEGDAASAEERCRRAESVWRELGDLERAATVRDRVGLKLRHPSRSKQLKSFALDPNPAGSERQAFDALPWDANYSTLVTKTIRVQFTDDEAQRQVSYDTCVQPLISWGLPRDSLSRRAPLRSEDARGLSFAIREMARLASDGRVDVRFEGDRVEPVTRADLDLQDEPKIRCVYNSQPLTPYYPTAVVDWLSRQTGRQIYETDLDRPLYLELLETARLSVQAPADVLLVSFDDGDSEIRELVYAADRMYRVRGMRTNHLPVSEVFSWLASRTPGDRFPSLVHILSYVREVNGTYALTDARSETNVWTTDLTSWMTSFRGGVCILDCPRPASPTELPLRIVARNQYARELFFAGSLAAVLGAGLWEWRERSRIEAEIQRTQGTLADLFAAAGSVPGAAPPVLFAHEPQLPFGVGISLP